MGYINEKEIYKLFQETPGIARLHVAQIDELPRADVVEVKHGKWQIEDRGGKPTKKPICSRCGATPKYYVNGKSSPYCQECGSKMGINVISYGGAKMDGGEK